MSKRVVFSSSSERVVPLGRAIFTIVSIGLVLVATVYLYGGGATQSIAQLLHLERDTTGWIVRQDIVDLSKTVAANADDPQAYVELGWTHFMAGDKKRAQAAYEDALSLDPNHIAATLNMGILYAELKQYENARASFEKVVKLNPGHELARFNLGVISIRERDYDGAVRQLRHVLRANPTSGDGWYYLGVAYEHKGDTTSAQKAYRKAVSFIPEHADAQEKIARLSKASGGGASVK